MAANTIAPPDGSVRGFVRNPDLTLTPEDYYADFAQGMHEIGYDGYIGYELCHPLPQVDGEPVGLDSPTRTRGSPPNTCAASIKDRDP